MANKPGNNGNVLPKSKGRKKGAKGKFTTLKQAFLNSFEELGGEKALTKWAKGPLNRKDFYQMVTKLLPKEIDGTIEFKNPPVINITFSNDRE